MGFFDFTFTDLIKTAGAIGTAWGGLEAAKVANDTLEYTKGRDAKADQKEELAQNNLDMAVDNVYGVKKKKETTLDNAYGTVATDLVS